MIEAQSRLKYVTHQLINKTKLVPLPQLHQFPSPERKNERFPINQAQIALEKDLDSFDLW